MAPVGALKDLCKLLQTAITTRQTVTAAKRSPLNLALAGALYKANLISWYTLGGFHQPDASIIATHTPEELARMRVAVEPLSKQRIWVGLKYANDEAKTPAMRRIKSFKKGPANILDQIGLRSLLNGQDTGSHKGLRPGELLFIATDRGVLECREALEQNIDEVTVVCKTSPFKNDEIVAQKATPTNGAIRGVSVPDFEGSRLEKTRELA